ncbi:hypothetical protein Poli38472_001417 [Pythium oligandrum]|uniref:Potassium channel domain-containing protein n=1 Tax=Pythium oligandrum TaxID=41045 RepID=A0A8K1CSX5_PYTOL|nr:hypothetical protein Poli38472_001417 [Pythium oligandrum]|eukprot:TMW69261.1 hypothetical protein Poli38472_001417 [Pythium oligandrum]
MPKDVERQALDDKCAQRPAQFTFVQDLRHLYRRRRQYELLACGCGLLGVLLMLAENEVVISFDGENGTKDAVLRGMKWTTLVSTVLLDGMILMQYSASTAILKMQNAVPATTNFIPRNYGKIILELLLCSFHIPPGINGQVEIRQFHSSLLISGAQSCPLQGRIRLTQDGNYCYLVYNYPVEAFGVFMLVRLYLFGRYIRSSSSLYSQWVAFIGSLNDINAMKPFFHFKALFKLRPLYLLVPLTLLNMFLAAAVIRILEQPVQAVFANYWKSVWLTAVTISATGFGDYYPVTYLGRAFTTVSAMFGGVLLVALIQSLFFGIADLSHKEEKVKYLVELNAWERATQENSAHLILAAWRWYKHKAQRDQKLLHAVYHYMRAARRLRDEKPTIELTLEEQITELERVVVAQMRRMDQEQGRILKRIQEKTRRVGELKAQLEARKRG